jgi:hypothetical protein
MAADPIQRCLSVSCLITVCVTRCQDRKIKKERKVSQLYVYYPPPPKVYNGHTHSSKADSFVCLAYWTPRLCRTSLYAAVILVIHPYSSTLHTCLFFFESLLTILHSSTYKASICQSLFAHVILKWLLTHVRHRSPAPHGRILCVHVSPRVHFPV